MKGGRRFASTAAVFPGTGHWKSLAGTNSPAYSALSQTTKKMKCFTPQNLLKFDQRSTLLVNNIPCQKTKPFYGPFHFYISPLTQPIQKTFFSSFFCCNFKPPFGANCGVNYKAF